MMDGVMKKFLSERDIERALVWLAEQSVRKCGSCPLFNKQRCSGTRDPSDTPGSCVQLVAWWAVLQVIAEEFPDGKKTKRHLLQQVCPHERREE